MTAFEDQHSLWTHDDRPEWTEGNAGVPDRRLVTGLDLTVAMSGANHLADIYPGDTFEVRDVQGDTVHTAGANRPERGGMSGAQYMPRRRRALGSRGA